MKSPILLLVCAFAWTISGFAQSGSTLNWTIGAIPKAHVDDHSATYHMFDAEGKKVGSMATQLIDEEDQITLIDTSQFDDGSVYEEATFTFSKKPIATTSIKIKMKTPNAKIDIDVAVSGKHAKGTYLLNEQTHQIDSTYDYDVVRAELYAFLGMLTYKTGMKKTVKVLAPMSFQVVAAEISVLEEEMITTPLGKFDTFKLLLDGKGVIPTNYIYVDKASHQVVKYEVTGQMQLDIVLMENR